MKKLSQGLGVKCSACHIKGAFDSDERGTGDGASDRLDAVLDVGTGGLVHRLMLVFVGGRPANTIDINSTIEACP
jgi:hypothetical protein